MNIDQKIGFFEISRKIIIHTTKHFYLFKPYIGVSSKRKNI